MDDLSLTHPDKKAYHCGYHHSVTFNDIAGSYLTGVDPGSLGPTFHVFASLFTFPPAGKFVAFESQVLERSVEIIYLLSMIVRQRYKKIVQFTS